MKILLLLLLCYPAWLFSCGIPFVQSLERPTVLSDSTLGEVRGVLLTQDYLTNNEDVFSYLFFYKFYPISAEYYIEGGTVTTAITEDNNAILGINVGSENVILGTSPEDLFSSLNYYRLSFSFNNNFNITRTSYEIPFLSFPDLPLDLSSQNLFILLSFGEFSAGNTLFMPQDTNQLNPRLLVAGAVGTQLTSSFLNNIENEDLPDRFGFTSPEDLAIFDVSGIQNVRILRTEQISSPEDRLFCRLINGHSSLNDTVDTNYLPSNFLSDATTNNSRAPGVRVVIYVVARGNGPPLFQDFFSDPVRLTPFDLTIDAGIPVACHSNRFMG